MAYEFTFMRFKVLSGR
jgi:hypothetical protein